MSRLGAPPRRARPLIDRGASCGPCYRIDPITGERTVIPPPPELRTVNLWFPGGGRNGPPPPKRR